MCLPCTYHTLLLYIECNLKKNRKKFVSNWKSSKNRNQKHLLVCYKEPPVTRDRVNGHQCQDLQMMWHVAAMAVRF